MNSNTLSMATGWRAGALSVVRATADAAGRAGATARLLAVLLAVLLAGCGGMTERDQQGPPDATVREPLSIECVDHTDCPRSLGYRMCRDNRCTFRCDDHVHHESDAALTNAEECVARGGVCEDVGAENWFCGVGEQ